MMRWTPARFASEKSTNKNRPAGREGHPHCLRYSAGTYVLAAGVPDRVVQDIFGHSSPAMTRLYQHVLPAMLEDAGRRLDAFFPAARTANQ